ncbi:MAG: excinuclease ABC subunit UvrB [Deltaproteobacteria bacterium]|nr:excinuclease ABC subunit UvrB [Deltaproteobacteria bacterium]
MATFRLVTDYQPTGDQPQAIQTLVQQYTAGEKSQVLLGVTGSGKTFTVAHVISRLNRPALVLAHNKTLAAQLYQELKGLFPDNAVEYFVSYYDYYQPEAYVPSTDTYIEKDATINDAIDRMRHSATKSLLERNDVIIVASVSCIYGLGSAEAYEGMVALANVGDRLDRDGFIRKLLEIQYERNDIDFHRGTFRVRGDTLEVFPAYEEEKAIRIEFFGDDVEHIREIDPLRAKVIQDLDKVAIYPASHYVTPVEQRQRAVRQIRDELQVRLQELRGQNLLVEAQRLEQRTMFDLEMMEQIGYCSGIENYSRHLTGRAPGQAPPTLLEYFPKDFLMVIDESHQTIPQLGAMYKGDRSRKETLVNYGFRLPSALDNRPLKFEELEVLRRERARTLYVSATPGAFELDEVHGVVVEQIIRPTGLVDPMVEVRPAGSQVDDLLGELRARIAKGHRVLVTTLTKRMAEDLTEYYADLGIKVKYLHADVDTLERMQILNELRRGVFDVLVGINLLREGLDLPEVSLVAILDADKEGFLRAERSLIQTIGRAARNVEGRVIMYADKVTASMKTALEETDRRRAIQAEYNRAHAITPKTIEKAIRDIDTEMGYAAMDYLDVPLAADSGGDFIAPAEVPALVEKMRADMQEAAKAMEFERAAELRDAIKTLQDQGVLSLGVKRPEGAGRKGSRRRGRNPAGRTGGASKSVVRLKNG